MTNTRTAARAALLAFALTTPMAVSAQYTDEWKFGAQIYGYFPSISGNSNFPGDGTSPDVSIDVDRIVDNIKFVFMGSLEAKKGRWGAFTDLIYMDIGTGKSGTRDFSVGGIQIPASATGDVDYDLKGTIWTIAGEYGVMSTPGASMDAFAGARMTDLEQTISWSLSGNIGSIPVSGRSGGSNVSRTNWDAIAGVKGRLHFGADHSWFVPYYLDVGAGDSDLTWQAMTGIGYSWKSVDVVAAWRYLDYDFGSGKPFTDINLSGPSLSVVFRW